MIEQLNLFDYQEPTEDLFAFLKSNFGWLEWKLSDFSGIWKTAHYESKRYKGRVYTSYAFGDEAHCKQEYGLNYSIGWDAKDSGAGYPVKDFEELAKTLNHWLKEQI